MVSEDMFDRHVTWAGSNADSLAVAIGVHAEVAGAELIEAQRFRDGPVAQQVTSVPRSRARPAENSDVDIFSTASDIAAVS